MSSAASIGGLISGLDTNSILDQLYELARTPIRRLEAKKETLNSQSLAWSQLEATLVTLQTAANQLAYPARFDAFAAAVSHPDLIAVVASSDAVPGTYLLTVNAIATTHQLASQGYADTDQTEVGTGTVTITVGDGDPTVIDVADFTLAELRDAINDSDAPVTASIINDGSDTDPYRLLLTSQTSGLDGEMDVVVSLSGGTAPTFSDLQPAQDAQIQLGSGAGAITISSSSNTFANVIEGVTLTLLDADPSTTVTLLVERDTGAIQALIANLADNYNALIDFFDGQFYYNPTTSESGLLFGDYRLRSLQQDLASALTGPIIGLGGEFSALNDIGIRAGPGGKLTLDSAAVAAAVADNLDDLIGLFAAVGSADHSDVTYLTASIETMPSGAAGWDVDITQAARQARVTAGVAQTEVLAANETLVINNVNIALTAGMTQAEVVQAINSYEASTGVTASATDADGEGEGTYLTLTRLAHGSGYHVEGVSTVSNQGGGNTSGIGNVAVTDEDPDGESGTGTGAVGLDVEGTIDGEPCTGSGRRLTAASGDPTGLVLSVAADEPGAYGQVYFTVGAAEAAFRRTLAATDTTDGTIAIAQDYLSDTADDIDSEIARLEDLIEQEHERLRASFVRMETALAEFQTQSQFLASQFAQMQANSAASQT